MKKKYVLIKDKKRNKNFHMIYDKINGFKIKPKKDLKYDGVKVDRMVLINRDITPYDKRADLVLHNSLGEIFNKI